MIALFWCQSPSLDWNRALWQGFNYIRKAWFGPIIHLFAKFALILVKIFWFTNHISSTFMFLSIILWSHDHLLKGQYGRHWSSRPMRIVAPTLFFSVGAIKGTDSIFFAYYGICFAHPCPPLFFAHARTPLFVFATAAKWLFSHFFCSIFFFIRRLQVLDKLSSRRQSSDGSQEHLFSSEDFR